MQNIVLSPLLSGRRDTVKGSGCAFLFLLIGFRQPTNMHAISGLPFAGQILWVKCISGKQHALTSSGGTLAL